MDKYKSTVIKLAICGVAIFSIGLIAGYNLDNGMLSSIQGFLLNAVGEASDPNATDSNATDSNATDSNATDSNATDSNATNSNATNSNATDANATDSNANSTDNILYLLAFKLEVNEVTVGDKVTVYITTSGAYNSAASIVFKAADGSTFTAQVQNLSNNKGYIEIPNYIVPSTYSITDVLLVGKNSDNTTFGKQYGINGGIIFNFDDTLKVNAKPTNNTSTNPSENTVVNKKIELKAISVNDFDVNVGGKLYFGINVNGEKLNRIRLSFASSDGKTFMAYAKDVNGINPYIEIPSNVPAGTYSLTKVVLTGSNGSTVYTRDGSDGSEKYLFNFNINVKETETANYVYNNEDVNTEVITKLYNAPSGSEITINSDSNTLINEELFNTIKGTDKKLVINYNDNQIIFNGNDITNSKTIDVNMTIGDISSNESINKLVSSGIIVNFPDNGDLPGKALVRVKATGELSNLNDTVYVYIFNESSNNFCEVDTQAKKSADGYYEFSITHNSNYLIVNDRLDGKLVVAENPDNVVSFQKSNKVILIIIVMGLAIAVAAAWTVFILNKKKKDNAKNNAQ